MTCFTGKVCHGGLTTSSTTFEKQITSARLLFDLTALCVVTDFLIVRFWKRIGLPRAWQLCNILHSVHNGGSALKFHCHQFRLPMSCNLL